MITFVQLCSGIEIWNSQFNKNSSGSFAVHDVLEGLSIFENAEWKIINSGQLKGCRYFETEHGLIVQQASGKISIIQKDMAKILGVV